jgi:general secretion pathway protein M
MLRLIKISLPRSRWLALGLLAAIAGLFFFLAVLPVLVQRAEYDASIENSIIRLQRLNGLVAKKDYWQKQFELAKQQEVEEHQFIFRETPALASADMQAQIGEVIKEARGELISTQALPEEKEDKFIRIGIKVRMTGSTRTLRKVLYHFKATYYDRTRPALFTQSLNIRPIRISQTLADGDVAGAVMEKLSIDFDVIGYMRAGTQ